MMKSMGKTPSTATKISGQLAAEIQELSQSQLQKLQRASLKSKGLCNRCKMLKKDTTGLNESGVYYDDSSALEAHTIARKGMGADIFNQQVGHIRHKKAFAIHVTDATDFDSSLIRSLRRWVGGNPIILAVTKCDLLPENIGDDAVHRRLKWFFNQRARAKDLNVCEVFLLSGKLNSGVAELVTYVYERMQGKDVFVVGNANVGKSTLVNAFTERMTKLSYMKGTYGRRRKAALPELRTTESALPGTTLMCTRIPCFSSDGHALFDTPGMFPNRFMWPAMHKVLQSALLRPQQLFWDSRIGVFATVTVVGQPLRIELHYLDALSPGKTAFLTWYSNLGVKAEIEHHRTRPVIPDTPTPTPTPISTSDDKHSDPDDKHSDPVPPPTLKLVSEVQPRADQSDHFSADMVILDLGWLAISSAEPLVVRVYAPPLTVVSPRECMWPPYHAIHQKKFITELAVELEDKPGDELRVPLRVDMPAESGDRYKLKRNRRY